MRKVTLNLPDELYEEVARVAKLNTRTVTQEVVHRLKDREDSFVIPVAQEGANTMTLELRDSQIRPNSTPLISKPSYVTEGSTKQEFCKKCKRELYGSQAKVWGGLCEACFKKL
jgi:hypothetical protein